MCYSQPAAVSLDRPCFLSRQEVMSLSPTLRIWMFWFVLFLRYAALFSSSKDFLTDLKFHSKCFYFHLFFCPKQKITWMSTFISFSELWVLFSSTTLVSKLCMEIKSSERRGLMRSFFLTGSPWLLGGRRRSSGRRMFTMFVWSEKSCGESSAFRAAELSGPHFLCSTFSSEFTAAGLTHLHVSHLAFTAPRQELSLPFKIKCHSYVSS